MLASADLPCVSCPAQQSGCVPPTQPSDPPTSCPPGLQRKENDKFVSSPIVSPPSPALGHFTTNHTFMSLCFVLTSSKCKSLNHKSTFGSHLRTQYQCQQQMQAGQKHVYISQYWPCIVFIHRVDSAEARRVCQITNARLIHCYILKPLPPEPESVSCDTEQGEFFVSAGQHRQLLQSPKLMQ